MTDLQLYNEISKLPADLRKEAQDFIEFLKTKAKKENPIPKRKFGYAKGFFKMHDDFNAPLEGFKDCM